MFRKIPKQAMIRKERNISIKISSKFTHRNQNWRPTLVNFNTDDKVIKDVCLTVLDPTMLHVDPSTTIIGEGALCDRMVENIVMWSIAPKSITQLFKEETRHTYLESTGVVTEVNSLRDSRYWENFANSSAETKIVLPFWFVAMFPPFQKLFDLCFPTQIPKISI